MCQLTPGRAGSDLVPRRSRVGKLLVLRLRCITVDKPLAGGLLGIPKLRANARSPALGLSRHAIALRPYGRRAAPGRSSLATSSPGLARGLTCRSSKVRQQSCRMIRSTIRSLPGHCSSIFSSHGLGCTRANRVCSREFQSLQHISMVLERGFSSSAFYKVNQKLCPGLVRRLAILSSVQGPRTAARVQFGR